MHVGVAKNKVKTFVIMAVITAIFYLVVYFFANVLGYGDDAIAIAGMISILSSFAGFWNSDKLVIRMSGAHVAGGQDRKKLESLLAPLCDEAGIPMPELYIIDEASPNAFATGRSPRHAALAVTQGLLAMMEQDELAGVLAHELSHIKNYDILLQTVASVMIGMVIILANFFGRSVMRSSSRRRSSRDSGAASLVMMLLGLVFVLLAPLAGQLLRMALSRNREYLADAQGASLVGSGEGLSRALLKLSAASQPVARANDATACLYITDPMKKAGTWRTLLATHPPIEKRVARLRAMDE